MSGYPFLAPSNITLPRAICNVVYQLQEKEGWKEAIAGVLGRRLKQMSTFVDKLLLAHSETDLSIDEQRVSFTNLSLTMMKDFCQEVWPCLAVLGGMGAGFCLGGECLLEENGEGLPGVIVATPSLDDGCVQVQELVTHSTSEVEHR